MTREEADALINLIPAPIYTSPDGQDLVLMSDVMEAIKRVATIEPEPHYDEWCTDCKEYDHERHCCPRWNRVIRETLEEIQANTDHIYAELSKVYNVKGLPDEAIGIIGDLMLSLDGPSA